MLTSVREMLWRKLRAHLRHIEGYELGVAAVVVGIPENINKYLQVFYSVESGRSRDEINCYNALDISGLHDVTTQYLMHELEEKAAADVRKRC